MEDRPRTLRVDTYKDFDKILQGHILIFDEETQHIEWRKITNRHILYGTITTYHQFIPQVDIDIAVEQDGLLVYRYISRSAYDIDVAIQWLKNDNKYQLICKDFEAVGDNKFIEKIDDFVVYTGKKQLIMDDKLGLIQEEPSLERLTIVD